MAVDADQIRPNSSPYPRAMAATRDWSAMLRFALRQAVVTLALTTTALAASPDVQRGKAYAARHCARCHAIDRVS
jgi:mono/diheme cytochrome c family protein